eukprot:COSAG01_NODE_1318_length_10746_cov_96.891425_8_plen_97_part_00
MHSQVLAKQMSMRWEAFNLLKFARNFSEDVLVRLPPLTVPLSLSVLPTLNTHTHTSTRTHSHAALPAVINYACESEAKNQGCFPTVTLNFRRCPAG